MARRKNSKIKTVLFKASQILVIVVLMLLIFVIARGIYHRVQDERNISKGVEGLRSEVQKFDQKNNNLNKLVQYFDSVEFQEKELKSRLNLVKEGEKVIFVQRSRSDNGEIIKEEEQDGDIITTHTNYYYWWKYFFERKFND